jgi:thiol-disulfide isomerase/thioredoxin
MKTSNHPKCFWIFFWAVLFAGGAAYAAEPVKGLALGDKLPSFELPGVDGKTHTEKEYADASVLMLIFTCNHCPTAQAYEERIMALEKDYRDKGVKLIAISPNDDKAVRLDELGYSDINDSLPDMKIRAKQRGYKFPYLYDGETQKFSRAVGVKVTPHVFIFDKDRKLRFNGRIDNSEFAEVTSQDTRKALDELLAGKPVTTPQTRVFGCSTKWAEKRGGVKAADERWAKEEVTLEKADIAKLKTLAANKTEDYLLINIWATWCGPCVAEYDDLVTIQRMYKKRHFKLVTISLDNLDDQSRVVKFLKKKQAAMTNLIFSGTDKDKLADAVDAKWQGPVPHTVFIAPGGKVVYRTTGRFDPVVLKKHISDSLGRTYASRKKKKKSK